MKNDLLTSSKSSEAFTSENVIPQKKKGFTLIEILAVLVVLAVISLIVVPVINKVMVNAREKLYDVQINNIEDAAKSWAAKNVGELPGEEGNSITITLGQIKLAGLIKEEVKNPITEELFPNDMEIEITYISNNYIYEVKEDSGTIGNNNPTLIIMVLKGKTHEYVEINTEYIDKGVTAKDPTGRTIEDIEITIKSNLQIVESVDTSRLGQYIVTYSAEYEGEKTSINRTVTVRDTIPPEITISENREIKISELNDFDLLSLVTTSDNSEMSVREEVEGSLVSIPGTYNITYKAYDESNNEARKVVEITVIDDIEPIVSFTPNGNSTYAKTHNVKINVSDQHGSIASSNYIWTASEAEPEMINQSFVDNENISTPAGLNGTYYLWVKATDNSGNQIITRSNGFKLDNTLPIITVPSNTVLKINEVTGYNLLSGVSVTDNSGETPQITVEGSLSKIAGSYTITYRSTDSSGNTGIKTRVIDVIDVEAPVITIIGSTTINVNVGTAYTDQGATAIDDADGNVTANITVTNPVNVNVPGTYTVTYRVKDSSNNESSATRTVNVIDNVAPTIEVYAGSMLYKDPTFASGTNSTGVYNNTGNGNVSITRKAISGIPGGSAYGLEIKTVGEATPGHGGFRFATPTSASKTYVTRILAKIPVGYNITFASNATGDGSTRVWLTSTAGTGKWEEYIHRVVTGSTGTFSTTNFYYLSGGSVPTTSNPLIWEVGYATVIEVGKWDETYNIITYSKDAHSMINSYRVQLSSTVLASKTYNPTKKEFGEIVSNLTSNGTYNIYSKDIHGNERTTSVAINRIDRTGPVISGVTINTSGITTTSFTINRTGNASDAHSGLAASPYIYQTSPNGSTWTTKCTNNSTSCNATGLATNTLHYYRVCVVDEAGNQNCTSSKTQYTLMNFETIVDSRDGKTYKIIKIGTQTWFAEDLAYTGNGCLNKTWSTITSEAHGCRHNESAQFPTIHYQFYAAMNGSSVEGSQGLCPAGWHIPTDNEWKTLEKYLGMTQSEADAIEWRGTDQAVKMKDHIYWNGTNETRFSGLPGGIRSVSVGVVDVGSGGSWWTSTRATTSYAIGRYFYGSQSKVYRVIQSNSIGYAVRCLKN